MLRPDDPNADTLFDRDMVVASRSIRPLWRQLMIVLLAVFLVDVAARRIAWDVAATKMWITQRFDAFAQLFKPRQVEAATTLAALKRHAAKTSTQTDEAEAASQQSAPAPPRTEQKFEAPDDFVPDKDFTATADAAAAKDKHDHSATADTASADDEPQTTSRLLDAKRRAQQKTKDQRRRTAE